MLKCAETKIHIQKTKPPPRKRKPGGSHCLIPLRNELLSSIRLRFFTSKNAISLIQGSRRLQGQDGRGAPLQEGVGAASRFSAIYLADQMPSINSLVIRRIGKPLGAGQVLAVALAEWVPGAMEHSETLPRLMAGFCATKPRVR